MASSVTGTFVNSDHPYAAHGPWLQVLIPDDFATEMITDIEILNQNTDEITFPKTFVWPDRKIVITIVPN